MLLLEKMFYLNYIEGIDLEDIYLDLQLFLLDHPETLEQIMNIP